MTEYIDCFFCGASLEARVDITSRLYFTATEVAGSQAKLWNYYYNRNAIVVRSASSYIHTHSSKNERDCKMKTFFQQKLAMMRMEKEKRNNNRIVVCYFL